MSHPHTFQRSASDNPLTSAPNWRPSYISGSPEAGEASANLPELSLSDAARNDGTALTQKGKNIVESDVATVLLQARSIQKSFNGVPALIDGRIDLRSGSIHALCGGNGVGKSTFLNILTGILRRDAGTLQFRGEDADFSSPKQSLEAGISIVTQELSPVPDLSVAENLFLGHQPQKLGFVAWRRLYKQAEELLERLNFKINPKARIRDLPLAQIQLVEIAKAMKYDARVLIMDEPTSSLGEQDVEVLFRTVRRLAELGTGIIYVSHRMTEIFDICDDYTVFRDGRFVEAGRIENTTRKQLVSTIIGRDYQDQFPDPKGKVQKEPIFKAIDVCVEGSLRSVNASVHRGEVLGIYGLVGAGRSEFLNTIYGLEKMTSGQLEIGGKPCRIGSPKEAIRNGIAIVPEDRKDSGLVLTSSVRDNISLSSLPQLSRAGFLRRGFEATRTKFWMNRLRIKAASSRLAVQSMSGGNQQKVVLARALETAPKLLLLDEPTRGVDAGAKQEIYEFIENYVAEGNGVIVVSSEVDEILGISSRIIVLRRGKVTADLPNEGLTAADLLHAAS